ncbi:MAG: flagellar protein FlgN [Proteobacteria bacterium]|nr:flagellar protein FlgN [Pseudomonadota bacterium]MBU1709408.1 flagellar protein FlgN [Pseudomonadota bacterium]
MEYNDSPRIKALPEAIFKILDQQVRLLKELGTIVEEEKKALSERDLSALVSLSRKKENQLKRIATLDTLLQETARNATNIPQDKIIRLEDLRPHANEEELEILEGRKQTLESMREDVLERNMMNKRFTHDVLGYLNDAIHLITGAVAERSTYGARGSERRAVNGPTLISREV